jgi:hypothetical protein
MTYAITPVAGFPAAEAPLFPLSIQWQSEGAALGAPNVRVVNFTGDPAVINVTRGTGEKSNVITVRLVPPPLGTEFIGWFDPIDSLKGVPYRTNFGGPGPYSSAYAGLEAWVAQVLVWTLVFTPTNAGDPPFIVSSSNGWVLLQFFTATAGRGTLTATVDGLPSANTIHFIQTPIDELSGTLEWGPGP